MLNGVDLVSRRARVRIRSMALGCESMTMAQGRVVAFSPKPMVCIEDEDGRQSWWLLEAAEEIAAPAGLPEERRA